MSAFDICFMVYYIVGGLLLVISTICMYSSEYQRNKKKSARLIMLSPIWPLIAPYGVFLFLRKVWRDADVEDSTPWSKSKKEGFIR